MKLKTNQSKVLLLIALVSLNGCIASDEFDESFKIDDTEMQEKFIQELKKEEIPIKVDERNSVWFKTEDRIQVHDIAFEVMNRKRE